MEAKDLGIPELSNQALVKIFLTDVNDNAPKIQPKQMDASVLEVIGFSLRWLIQGSRTSAVG